MSGAQGRRVEETAAGGSLPGLRLNQNSNQAVLSHLMANADSAEPDDDFFDMLVKCQVSDTSNFRKKSLFDNPKSDCYVLLQGSRLDDQRCAPPPPPARGPTVPDEDFFSLIMRSQAKRMDEQRVTLPNSTAQPSSS